jgi:hypothetical protein
MKYLLLFSLFTFSTFAQWSGESTKLDVKLVAAWISQNGDCTDAIELFNHSDDLDSVEFQNFSDSPSLGSASGLELGSYKCVVLKMSSLIKFEAVENSTNGLCQAGVEQSMHVCNGNQQSTGPDGTVVTCDGENEAYPYLYISTFSQNDNDNDSWNRPTAANSTNGVTLEAALELLSEEATGTFTVNPGSNPLSEDESNRRCDHSRPAFSFASSPTT